MNYTKFFGIGLVCISTSVGFSTLSHAENSIFTKTDTQQKQWVGKPAPMFKLQDQHKKWHELSQYKGKWVVLYFYPKDDTPGCTLEACSFRDNVDLKKMGVEPGVKSVDEFAQIIRNDSAKWQGIIQSAKVVVE